MNIVQTTFSLPINMLFLLLFVQLVYVGIRWYVKGWRETRGYPFAFQILGYLKWENDGTIDDILPKFDEELTVYAYEKIWSELSELDRKIVYIISQGVNKTGDIRESLGVSPQLLNTYRKRLMERGVVDGSRHGELTLALPRFEEYINMYCEVTI